jgi:type III restriction enzyme
MPTGLLIFCLEYATGEGAPPCGIFEAIRGNFSDLASSDLRARLRTQYEFRNEYVAHEKREPLRSTEAARDALRLWVRLLSELRGIASAAPERASLK